MFKSLIKAILKVIRTIMGYTLIMLTLDFITNLLPLTIPILLAITIIGLTYIYYKENKKEEERCLEENKQI